MDQPVRDSADRHAALDSVRRDGLSLASLPHAFRGDRELVLEAVRQNGLALQYAAVELQLDRELALEAVKQNGSVLLDISPGLLADRDVVLEAVRHDDVGMVLGGVVDELRADKQVVLEAVQRHPHALEDAADELKADRDVVLTAVRQDGWALLFAAPQLWADREVVVQAVRQRPAILKDNSLSGFRADKGVVLEAVQQEGLLLQHVVDSLRADREVVLAAVRNCGLALGSAAEGPRADKEVVLEAVRRDGLALQVAAEALRADRDVVLAAVASDGNAARYAADFLRGDRGVMTAAVRNRGSAIQFAKPPLKATDGCLLREAKLMPSVCAPEDASGVTLRDIILSVRFSLGADCSAIATRAHKYIQDHEFFREAYRVYDPNLVSKGFCGQREDMTNRAWPCRGDCSMVRHGIKNLSRLSFVSGLSLLCPSRARPFDAMCWRRSFMWHLRNAQTNRGFMLQLEEPDPMGEHCLGPGQVIEAEMAELSQTKVFRMRVGTLCTFNHEYAVEVEYTEQMMSMLIEAVSQWLLSDCDDMGLVELNEDNLLQYSRHLPAR